MVPRLKEVYKSNVVPSLKSKFSYKNHMEIPRVEKIVINMGLGSKIYSYIARRHYFL